MDRKDVVTDPVCVMRIEKDTAVATSTHGGAVYYFCSHMCKDRFDKAFDKEPFIRKMKESEQR